MIGIGSVQVTSSWVSQAIQNAIFDGISISGDRRLGTTRQMNLQQREVRSDGQRGERSRRETRHRQNRKSNTSLPIQSADARGNVPDLKKGSLQRLRSFWELLEASGAWKRRHLRGRDSRTQPVKSQENRANTEHQGGCWHIQSPRDLESGVRSRNPDSRAAATCLARRFSHRG